MNYPLRSDDITTALERLPETHFSQDDKPFLSIARYSISPDYEPSDIDAKRRVDSHGTMDAMYWYAANRQKREAE